MTALRPWILLMAAAFAAAGAVARAQAPAPPPPPPPGAEPPALSALRAEFLGGVVTASKQLTDQFTNALAKLEDEFAAAGDYEEAIRVQARRKEVEASIGSAAAPAPPPGIPLAANVAKTSATISVDEGSLTGWRTLGNFAEWSLQKLTPGRYTLQFSYLCTDAKSSNPDSTLLARYTTAETVKFRFLEVSLLAPASANTRALELSLAKDPSTYTAVTTEPISILRASITLRLEMMQSAPANAIRIKDIRLVPVDDKPAAATPGAVAVASSGDGQKNVDALKQVFLKQMTAARAPIMTDYLARLKTLAAQPSVTKDRDLLDEIEAEQKRATEISTTPPSIGSGAKGRRGPGGVPGGLDGFEDVSGARLVADPANTAEKFKVEHEGRQFWVKLAWVRCPPASADDKDSLQTAMKHFKIDEDEALLVGRMAQEFTIGYLEERPLRLLVRSNKKNSKTDAAPALVFLDDIGLFQSALVERGLAAVFFPPGLDHKSTIENGMMKMLTEREQKAMKRRPAPGAWSFSSEGSK